VLEFGVRVRATFQVKISNHVGSHSYPNDSDTSI